MTFPSNNSVLTAEDGTVLFWRSPTPNKFIPSGYPLKMKIEYPSGSGNYLSDWHTINPQPLDVISNYVLTSDPKSNKYRILVKHPCNPNDIVYSSEYTFVNPIASRNGSCSPYVDRVITGYDCGEIAINITYKSNPSINRSYVWDDDNTSFPLDVTDLPEGKYSVQVTTSGGYTYMASDVDVGSLPTINTSLSYNYISTQGCDFTTGGIRVYGIGANDVITKTYTLISGPVSRSPISGVKDMDLWTDLPAGTYQMKIQYGTCGSVTRNFTLTMPYSGFKSGTLSYTPSAECGKYHITGPAGYLASDGKYSSTGTYIANIYNSSGTFIAYYTAVSGQAFISGPLDPGTYKVTFQSSSHTLNICSYTQAEKYITIPPYMPLAVDVSNSGGFVCQSGHGVLHIDTVGGSGQEVTYRIKPKDALDSQYTSYQTSPDFLPESILFR